MRRALLALLGLATACGSEPAIQGDAARLPWRNEALPEPPSPADNPLTDEKQRLGRLLFYDPLLSSDRTVACGTCHSEYWGLGDGLPRSIGIGGSDLAGPGRVGTAGRRNAQTLWNVAYRSAMFVDGRVVGLEAQVLAPLADAMELGRDADEVVRELAAIPEYRTQFEAAFPGEPLGVPQLSRALAAFQRTLVSRDAPYDRFGAGDDGALDADARRGMALFAEARCHDCHTPPLFEGERYARRLPLGADRGRAEITGDDADAGAFRVPTLRNVRSSAPYFHDGSVTELADAVRLESELSERPFDAAEASLVAHFLDSGLTDTSREPARPKTVPSGLPVPRDGFRITR